MIVPMSAALSQPFLSAEPVLRRRFEQLRAAGYTPEVAELLSERGEIDLHLAVDLPRRGCPSETAQRILL